MKVCFSSANVYFHYFGKIADMNCFIQIGIAMQIVLHPYLSTMQLSCCNSFAKQLQQIVQQSVV